MHGKWGFLQEQLRIDYQSIEKSGLKWEFPHHHIDVPERWLPSQCRWDNGPISELPTETELMARACHYHCPEICYEFDIQKPRILILL